MDIETVRKQLQDADCDFRYFGRPEVRELPNLLTPGEVIAQCVNGFYEGGFAMLCVTNERLLLVDRKAFFMTVEDIHFDMIAEIDHGRHIIRSYVRVYTPNKTLSFNSFDKTRLGKLCSYLQLRVMESRQRHSAIATSSTDTPEPALASSNWSTGLSNTFSQSVDPAQPATDTRLLARIALSGIDRYAQLPLIRRRRYPSFYI